ncbi:MAG: Do family serine endopeptidase [Myxococcaceae bacterium]
MMTLGLTLALPVLAQIPPPNLASLAPLVESTKSAVVNVEVQSKAQDGIAEMFDGPFRDWFGFQGPNGRPNGQRREFFRKGAGSGFLISPNGLVVTNNHVVENAVALRIKLDDGRTFDADVVGLDPMTDVAVLRLKQAPKNLPHVKFGDSDALRVGDWVVAIGNPFGLASSVSAGILSARAREIGAGPYDDFLQTDAAINPGNSGGPLFNLAGEVVGINTAIVGGGTGIGFAVPSNLAKGLVPQLEKNGRVTRGWLGAYVQDLTPDIAQALRVPVTQGAILARILPESPAAGAGLRQDDVVVALDNIVVTSSRSLTRNVALKRPGSTVAVGFFRGPERRELRIKLGELPREGADTGPRKAPNDSASPKKLGLMLEDSREGKGAFITAVAPGSPAQDADLREGMVVVEAAGKPIRNASELAAVLRSAKPGTRLLLRVTQPNAPASLLRALSIP